MASANVPLLNDDDDDTIQFGEEEAPAAKSLKHPYVTFFHLFFRISAVIIYLMSGYINSYITSFVIVILLLSMDFWTVKNITGRLLVGLRWWNYVDDDGKSHWVFESKKANQQSRLDSSEVRIFWLALVFVPVIWSLLFIIGIFRFNFEWVLLVCIAISLNGANLFAYIKCRIGGNEPFSSSLSNLSSNFFRRQLITNMANMMSSRSQEQPGQRSPSII